MQEVEFTGNTMTHKMPVLFVGHGSPMNAIEKNEFGEAWEAMGKSLPRPKAIVSVSAHWETIGTKVTAMDRPKTIYDFYGFPKELYEASYPAPGAPQIAEVIRKMIKLREVEPDFNWGLDHGTWSVLYRMFPNADIPVLQMSLDRKANARDHYELGRQLQELREEGVLILGSGNIVHNLGMIAMDNSVVFDWAADFDQKVKGWIETDDHDPLINYHMHGKAAALSINSAEHYKPLLYTLGLKDEGEPIEFFADTMAHGSISMRSVKIG
jgi:4,5-DOPA dioxygenase extradiol